MLLRISEWKGTFEISLNGRSFHLVSFKHQGHFLILLVWNGQVGITLALPFMIL